MKFEEVLPKMRDEGKIANLHGVLYKIGEGNLWAKYISRQWKSAVFSVDSFTTDDWKLEPVRVSKWRWVFGLGSELQMTAYGYLSEAEAEEYRFQGNYDWAEKIEHTRKEVEE